MHYFILPALLWITTTATIGTTAIDPGASAPVTVDRTVFSPGEKMVFRVAYTVGAFWLNAGEIVFKLEEKKWQGKPYLHVRVDGQTYKSYEWFYKVKDRYETYMNQETLLPQLFIRDANQGGYIMRQDYVFNQPQHLVYTKDYVPDPAKLDTFKTVPGVHDIVSILYYARTIDYGHYQPGDKIPIHIFIDGDTYELNILFMGRDRIKTSAGKFDVLVIQSSLVDNQFFDPRDKITIYVTDDKNKIPVRVESPLTIGSVKADLIGFGGLTYPFRARVD